MCVCRKRAQPLDSDRGTVVWRTLWCDHSDFLQSWPSMATAASLVLGRVMCKAGKRPGVFLDSWAGESTCHCGDREAPSLHSCSPPGRPSSMALPVGCLGMRPGPGCPAVAVSGRWLLQGLLDFQVSLAGLSGICRRSCRKVTWTPSPLRFLPQRLLFLFCFRSGCLPALHPSVGIGYASSQDLGFSSSTQTLDLLSEPTGSHAVPL